MLLNTETVNYEYDVVQVVYAMELGQREKNNSSSVFWCIEPKKQKAKQTFPILQDWVTVACVAFSLHSFWQC